MSYKTEKVTTFLTLYQEYINQKGAYNNKIDDFISDFETVLNNYNDTNTDNTDNVIYKYDGPTNHYFIKTPEQILMKMSGNTTLLDSVSSVTDLVDDIPDTKKNKVIDIQGSNVYYTDVLYNITDDMTIDTIKKIQTNTYNQLGLGDLSYNNFEMDNANELYVIPTSGTSVSLHSDNCNTASDNLPQCAGYAKMTNQDYYGLGEKGGNCECFLFNQEEKDMLTNTIIDISYITATDSGGTNHFTNVNHLGILMDGSCYTLVEKIYSDNFNLLYNTDSTKKHLIINSTINPDCHPFTGSGVNN